MEIGYASHIGKRDLNEDSLLTVEYDAVCKSEIVQTVLLVVADGMGGHNAGEVASRLAIEGICQKLLKNIIENKANCMGDMLRRTIKEVNKDIYTYVEENPRYRGMGTTMTVAVIQGPHLSIGHVGDTRAYLICEQKLIQVTTDHSLVQEMVDNKEITKAEARYHPQRNIITRAVGISSDVEVDIYTEYIYGNDYILITSDGLTDIVADEEIYTIVREYRNPQKICDILVETADSRGGPDNISVVVAQIDELRKREDVLSDETHLKFVIEKGGE
ncbi:MAG: Stp1/IreP family PP2C-type Ser/Thr phosphatase [Theionarchaea archaeon]|nr:Stp1/IreP family PP2C-type Ser/Thr phosphatase [Theionarchaea archaeon]